MKHKYVHVVLKNGKRRYFTYVLPNDSIVIEELLNSDRIKYYWIEEA